MSYSAITTTEIATGKPVANTTLTKVKDNFIDHETRILDLENGGAVAYPPKEMSVRGYYGDPGIRTNWGKWFPNFDITITGVRLIIDTAGTSGSTEIDLKVNFGGGAYTSIFTTKPSVAFGAGNDAVSSNQVLDATKVDVDAGEIVRLDTTAVQTNGHTFYVRIDYVKR